jgi:hypothetical protein
MVVDSNRFKQNIDFFFVDNAPVVENWMLGMCDVADCINDVRDPETIRFSDFQNSKTYVKTKITFIKSVYPLTINLIIGIFYSGS